MENLYRFARHPFTTIVAFAGLLIIPAFYFGPTGDDLYCISLRAQLFADQLWHGDLYPRWLMDMFAGYGTPVFFYYPPLAFYITSLFSFLASYGSFAFAMLSASAVLSLCVAGMSFYAWMREEELPQSVALIGSLLYLAAPDNLGNNFYYWMLFSSVWAYAWVPLLLLFARRLALGKRYSVIGFAIALCLLILTHLPYTLIFGPVAIAYSAWCMFTRNPASLKYWLRNISFGVALAFGLSAFYLTPALSYMDYTYIDRHWTQPDADYHHYFLILGFKSSNQIIYTIAWLAMAALSIGYSWILYRRNQKAFLFFGALSLAGLFMILPQSRPLWEFISPLKILQFPERFFTVPSLCLAALASAAMPRMRTVNYLLLAAYVVLAFTMANMDMHRSVEDLRRDTLQYEKYTLKVDQYSQYFTTQIPFERQHTLFYTLEGLKQVKKQREQVQLLNGDAAVTINHWSPRHIAFHYQATQNSALRIRQFYFPGFTATLNDQPLAIHVDEDTAALVIEVPTGQGQVTLTLERLLPEIAGMLISIISAGAIALLLLLSIRKPAKS